MKNTPLFQSVCKILSGQKKPFSVPEIQTLLARQNLNPNKTTLYRMLEKMVESGAVEAILLDSKTTFYEIKSHHHHHFRCQKCDQIQCLSDPQLEHQIHQLQSQMAKRGFAVENHHFSLSGKCKMCA